MKALHTAPGIALALLLAAVSYACAGYLSAQVAPLAQIPVSPIMIAILLGILLCNALRPGPQFIPGLQFSVNRVLQLGIDGVVSPFGLNDCPFPD